MSIVAARPTLRAAPAVAGPVLAGGMLTLAVTAALLAWWTPIAFPIVTVFLFAGPHNWLEARYFLTRLPAGVQLFSLFLANPGLLSLVADIMAEAPRLAESLAQRPALLDAVLAAEFSAALPDRAGLDGGDSLFMAAKRKLICLLAANAKARGQPLRGQAHGEIRVRVVVHQPGIDGDFVAAHGNYGHGFRAPANRNFGAPRHD